MCQVEVKDYGKWPFKVWGRLYKRCVGSVLGYGEGNWSVGMKELNKLVSTEKKMLAMMCGVTLKDRLRNSEGLRWFRHVLRRGEDTEEGGVLTMEVSGARRRGRLAMRWKDWVGYDMRVMGLEKRMAMDRET